MIKSKKLVSDLENLFTSFAITDPGDIEQKSANDFVTTLDFKLQASIINILQNHKNVPVLGEESPKLDFMATEEFWVVDPLDGTSNFIKGIPFIASAIALVSYGVVTFGLVYDFGTKKSYWAELGGGSYLGSDILKLDKKESGPKLVGCSTGFLKALNRSPTSNQHVTVFDQFNFRVLGSQALQLCYVAAGKLDANFSIEAKIWDDLAASLILSEAGCYYHSIALNKEKILACFMQDIKMKSVAGIDELQFGVGMNLMKELDT